MGDLAEAMGVQKASLYSRTGSKQELLYRANGVMGAERRAAPGWTRFPTSFPRSTA